MDDDQRQRLFGYTFVHFVENMLFKTIRERKSTGASTHHISVAMPPKLSQQLHTAASAEFLLNTVGNFHPRKKLYLFSRCKRKQVWNRSKKKSGDCKKTYIFNLAWLSNFSFYSTARHSGGCNKLQNGGILSTRPKPTKKSQLIRRSSASWAAPAPARR